MGKGAAKGFIEWGSASLPRWIPHMSRDLSLAQPDAVKLVRSLMVPVALLECDGTTRLSIVASKSQILEAF